MTGRATVLVTSRSFGGGAEDPAATLAAHGLEVARGPADHDPEALAPLLAGAVAWIAGSGPVTDDHLRAAPRLRIVARYGTGVDAVDLDAARRREVVVTNTPGANASAVAEHTVALMLACLRQVVDADRQVRAGRWSSMRGRELGAATVGLVGLGAVGRRVAGLVAGFGSTVLAHDPAVAGAADAGDVEMVALERVWVRADVISLHCPPAPRPLVDRPALARMRRGTVIVNTARAGLLDEGAVADALHADDLGALGADVLGGDDRSPSPLRDAPRTVLTPHCAAQTVEAVDRMGRAAVDEVVRVVAQDRPPRHRVA